MHTRVTLSDVLVEGHLHEIIAALREMDPNEFIQIKAGARLLVLNKALDVIENDDAKLDRARNEFLRILPVLAVHVDADRYQRIVSRALPMAFEHPYGKWIGDRDIREGLHEACVHAEANHGVLAEEFLSYLEKTTLEARPGWFYHAVRDVLVRLMTNTRCTDELANRLDQMLQRINRLQREATPTLGFGDLEKQPDTTTNAGRQAPEG
jgi:hypothetical protein